MSTCRAERYWFSLKSGPGVPPVNHAQDARATIKLKQYPEIGFEIRGTT